ncbi:MAG: hypothetical protein FWC68_03610 [Oscillospiraceae bacterium]|nr:hypothetical protein [Oscillospiraceae bacterium]
MSKTIKILSITVLMALALVVLTGCGGSSNRIVATRDMSDMGMNATETLEITFRNDTIYSAVATIEFEDEEEAEVYYSIMQMVDMEGIEFSLSGSTLTMTLDVEDFVGDISSEDEVSRDEMIEILEEQGYTIR